MPNTVSSLRLRAVVLLIFLGLLAGIRSAAGASLNHNAGRIEVTTARYAVTVNPERGGRITSFRADGVPLTDPANGLLAEANTAGLRFDVERASREGQRVRVRLAARAGDLRVEREYVFSDAAPYVLVRSTYENHGSFPLSGADAPAVRSLPLPGEAAVTGRERYCIDAGRGSRVLSPLGLLTALHGGGGGELRWLAVTEPASRNGLGFVLRTGGCSPLPPLRGPDGGLVVGWRAPAIPAGGRLTVEALLVPLRHFPAVTGLNRHLAIDSVLDSPTSPSRVRISLLPLHAARELSVVTRAYDADGAELEPCTPLLLDEVEALEPTGGEVTCPDWDSRPAWLTHEVYSGEGELATMAVPVGDPAGPPPVRTGSLRPASLELLSGTPAAPGERIPVGPAAEERGFVVWRFDGRPPESETEELTLHLTTGCRRTIFIGLRTLRRLQDLEIALATTAESDEASGSRERPRRLPPAATYLWTLAEGPAPALTPMATRALPAGRTAWFAVTVDGTRLQAAPYTGALQVRSDGGAQRIPISLNVTSRQGPGRQPLGLCYLAPTEEGQSIASAWREFGADSAVVAARPETFAALGDIEAGSSFPGGLRAVGLAAAGGVLPPGRTVPHDLALPFPQPLWFLRSGASTTAAIRSVAGSGFSLALLGDLPREGTSYGGTRNDWWLLQKAPDPGAVPRLVETEAIDGDDLIWLHLDLRGVDWRRAAIRARRAFWLAAWQNLSGVAVECDPPGGPQRRNPLWHILRDARQEAALWRSALRRAETLVADQSRAVPARGRKVVLLQRLRGIAGSSPDALLNVARPGDLPSATQAASGLARFREAHEATMALVRELDLLPQSRPEPNYYCAGLPLMDGAPQWTIYAGSAPRAAGLAERLRARLEELTDRTLPVTRAWPASGAGLVWAIVDGGDELPPELIRNFGALRRPAVKIGRWEGQTVVLASPDVAVGALTNMLTREREMLPRARDAR